MEEQAGLIISGLESDPRGMVIRNRKVTKESLRALSEDSWGIWGWKSKGRQKTKRKWRTRAKCWSRHVQLWTLQPVTYDLHRRTVPSIEPWEKTMGLGRAPLVKCLLCHHENQVQSQNPHKREVRCGGTHLQTQHLSDVVTHTCSPITGEEETGRSLRLANQSV